MKAERQRKLYDVFCVKIETKVFALCDSQVFSSKPNPTQPLSAPCFSLIFCFLCSFGFHYFVLSVFILVFFWFSFLFSEYWIFGFFGRPFSVWFFCCPFSFYVLCLQFSMLRGSMSPLPSQRCSTHGSCPATTVDLFTAPSFFSDPRSFARAPILFRIPIFRKTSVKFYFVEFIYLFFIYFSFIKPYSYSFPPRLFATPSRRSRLYVWIFCARMIYLLSRYNFLMSSFPPSVHLAPKAHDFLILIII